MFGFYPSSYLRKPPLLIITSSILNFLFSLHIVVGQNALKLCTRDGGVHQMGTETCARGAWVGDGLDVDCVCVRGLWLLSSRFCDKEFFIFSGRENDCFKVNRPIRRFLSLMDNEDLSARKIYYFRHELEKFESFDRNLSLSSKSGEASFLLRYNDTENPIYLRHEEGVPSKFWQKCYHSSEGNEMFQIVRTDGATFLSGSGGGRDCEGLRDLKFGYGSSKNSVWEMDMRSGWHSKYGLLKTSKKCEKSCGQKKSRKTRSPKKTTADKMIMGKNHKITKPTTQSSTLTVTDKDNMLTGDDEVVPLRLSLNLGDDDKQYDQRDYEDALPGGDSLDVEVMTERLRDNGRDTVRIANYLKKWIFHNVPGPRVAQKEFKYLQIARIVFLKSCPDVDGDTVTNFFRLFRFLVYETLRKHPHTYPENTEANIHTRIVTTMKTCFKNAAPYKVDLDLSACTESGVKVLSVTDSKGVQYPPAINATEEDDVTFKTGLASDTVLETAWKLMLHAHYQCAEDFRNHPEDLSWMYIKLQEFLTNPHIIFRWENPGEYLNQVYAFMHPGFHLAKFAKTVDACVSAAKEASVFEEWMQRPKRERDFHSETVKGRSMALLGAKDQGKPNLFEGKGYCVNKFDDPITWTHFNPSVNAKCH